MHVKEQKWMNDVINRKQTNKELHYCNHECNHLFFGSNVKQIPQNQQWMIILDKKISYYEIWHTQGNLGTNQSEVFIYKLNH